MGNTLREGFPSEPMGELRYMPKISADPNYAVPQLAELADLRPWEAQELFPEKVIVIGTPLAGQPPRNNSPSLTHPMTSPTELNSSDFRSPRVGQRSERLAAALHRLAAWLDDPRQPRSVPRTILRRQVPKQLLGDYHDESR